MIRVTVELWPHGDDAKKRKLAHMDIFNDATGTKSKGNYKCRFHAEYTRSGPRTGTVQQFNRQSQSVWSLVGAFLKLFGHTRHSPKLMSK